MRVVVIGNDAGAVRAALELGRTRIVDVVVLSDSEHFAPYAPLLFASGVASGALQPRALWSMFDGQTRIRVVCDTVKAIDAERRIVRGAKGSYQYDYVIVSRYSTRSYSSAVQSLEALIRSLRMQYSAAKVTDTHIVIEGRNSHSLELAMRLDSYLRGLYKGTRSRARISVATASAEILPDSSPQCRTLVRREMVRRGIDVQEGVRIGTVTRGNYRTVAGRKVPASQVVSVESGEIEAMFASQSVIFDVNERGLLQLSPHLEVYDRIYAIGGLADASVEMTPLRVLDMADYVVDRITTGTSTAPYIPATAVHSIALHDRWAYAECFGIYVAGSAGSMVARMLHRRAHYAVMP